MEILRFYRLLLRGLAYRKAIVAAGFLAGFALAIAMFVLTGAYSVSSALSNYMDQQMKSLDQVTSKWFATMGRLSELGDRDACSQSFVKQLRGIAFIPDGVHELLYASGDKVICSVTMGDADQPIALGQPDFALRNRKIEFWTDRNLDPFGLHGLEGTFMRSGNFLMIIIPPELFPTPAPWLKASITFNANRPAAQGRLAPANLAFGRTDCDVNGVFCVEAGIDLRAFLADKKFRIGFAFAIAILLGWAVARILDKWLDRLWAFPMRLRKLMDESSIYCVYQPILSLADDRIDAVEVLARWRDITGETVMPGHFLPIVEAGQMTRTLTELVVRNVQRDLQGMPERDTPLRIHFNIYPQDFDAEWLLSLFAPIRAMSEHYVVVIEILECQQTTLEHISGTVETLNENGILSYVDDFGAGYTNIEYLGHLALSEVKLDRSFGMAPEGSLMAELLVSAATMITRAGFTLVVEGVETREKLDSLRKGGLAQYAQGYHISRPLEFADLVAFMQGHGRQNRERRHSKPARRRLRVAV
ncbi:MAG: EAL domain-containing protein [Hyphomicrobiales bacterium]|nr:EAL domain-containing protein [Hyphomicrobiales bacterium]